MSEPKYLLGNGERLSAPAEKKAGGSPKNYPYEFAEAVERISSGIKEVSDFADRLIDEACPHDKIVFSLTLHPRFVSKSDFPSDFLNRANLRVVGGRSKYVEPENWGTSKNIEGAVTDCLFVSASRSVLRGLPDTVAQFSEESTEGKQLRTIEAISLVEPKDRIKKNTHGSKRAFEVVLHSDGDEKVLDQFYKFAAMFRAIVDPGRVRFGGGVIFVPVKLEQDTISEVAQYSFLRAIRPMPRLRTFKPPVLREGAGRLPPLPELGKAVGDARVAIFDGGMPPSSPLMPWVNYIEPVGIGTPEDGALGHGEAVTSAFLFGHLAPTSSVLVPPARVDHIRVIDNDTGAGGDYECYDALERIVTHLQSATPKYEYVNLSLGPDLPVEDDEINAWTSTLDEVVGQSGMLLCCAAGNSGEQDAEAMLNRIQPPSDGVNVLSVGACDSPDDHWRRSSYSSIGPGRTPGVAKPDGVIFGGAFERPFGVVSTASEGLAATQGTSFASPLALRSAVSAGVITEAGRLDPLAIRALMVHTAEAGEGPAEETGWGRFQSDPIKMLTCNDSEVSVLYRGVLPIKEYLRSPIPLPKYALQGNVELTATLVISPEVDAAYVNAYTRAGLEVVFRPNSKRVKKPGSHSDSDVFFSKTNMYKAAEYQLRTDGHKWEPCWKATKTKQGGKLNDPCFDIYYHSRIQGRPDSDALPIPYAFVVTIRAPKIKTLYEDTLAVYADVLTPIEPTVTVPVEI